MNRYRNLLPLLINGEHGQGDVFDLELSEADEADNLASGLLEIVPATYKVTGESRVFDTEPGGTFQRALTVGQEGLLVKGGFIERLPDEPLPEKPEPASKSRRKTRTEKESKG